MKENTLKHSLIAFAVGAALTSCGGTGHGSSGSNFKLPPGSPVKYLGGGGSSPREAIVIKDARDNQEGLAAQDQWMKKNHPKCSWEAKDRGIAMGNTTYNIIECTEPSGGKEKIYFDVTDSFSKF